LATFEHGRHFQAPLCASPILVCPTRHAYAHPAASLGRRVERRNRLRKHGMNDGDAGTEPGADRTQVEDVDKRARRGIAAAAAISSIPVVLRPGQTSLTLGSGFYRDAGAVSVSLTHRLNTAVPIYVQGGYSNGGGTENVGRVAASIVW
jgi:YadA-like membrane anchor domain